MTNDPMAQAPAVQGDPISDGGTGREVVDHNGAGVEQPDSEADMPLEVQRSGESDLSKAAADQSAAAENNGVSGDSPRPVDDAAGQRQSASVGAQGVSGSAEPERENGSATADASGRADLVPSKAAADQPGYTAADGHSVAVELPAAASLDAAEQRQSVSASVGAPGFGGSAEPGSGSAAADVSGRADTVDEGALSETTGAVVGRSDSGVDLPTGAQEPREGDESERANAVVDQQGHVAAGRGGVVGDQLASEGAADAAGQGGT
ncbi:hypothetical protein, partial [Nocardia alni]|uniref:hypothetical protein n=1 Tax=Nocardia alni TaxID=2815723 RepID=UPI001C23AEA3